MTSPVRVALVTEIPAPFRVPLFNELAQRDDVALRTLFLSERDPTHPYRMYADEHEFDWTILPGVSTVRGGRWIVLNRRILRELLRYRPDVVVLGGWNQPAFWQSLAYAKARRIPAIGWVESTARDDRPQSASLERVKRLFLRSCDAFFVPGRASRDYLVELGVAPEQIDVAPNAVDLAIFRDRVELLRGDRAALRDRLGAHGFCVLTAARLEPEKGIDVLIRAVGRAAGEVSLVVAGAGSQAAPLRALAEEVAPGRVRFLGFVQRDELVQWYAAADAFALASRSDQWGMVLNEAAAAALPVVATDAPGAAWDLVEDGVNGYRVPAGDVDALAAAIGRLGEDGAFREQAGARSAELAARHTPEAWAAAVAARVRRSVEHGSR